MNFIARLLLLVVLMLLAKRALAERFDYHSIRGRTPAAFLSGRYEAEQMEMNGQSRPQPMTPFGNQWSDQGQLLWDGKLGQSLETSFETEEAGRFDIQVQLTLAPDYGRFDLELNGNVLSREIDLFDPRVKLAPIVELKNVQLAAGTQLLTFHLTGQNAKAKMIPGDRLLMGIDYVHLKRLDPPPPEEDTPIVKAQRAEATTLKSLNTSLEQHCYA